MPEKKWATSVGAALNSPWLGNRFLCRIIFSRSLIITPNLQQRSGPQGRKAVRCAAPPPGALQHPPTPHALSRSPPPLPHPLPATAQRPPNRLSFLGRRRCTRPSGTST